jgi:Cu(I)/Ag(I) efflux system membrane fusion protein
MKKHIAIAAASTAAVLALSGYGLYTLGMQRGMQHGTTVAEAPAAPSATAASEPARRILYWHDPMVPGPRFDKPGKSPFMDMQLVPVYAESDNDAGVSISPRAQQNLGVRTAEVVKGRVATRIDATGSVAWDERDVAMVPARSNGYVDKLLVRAPFAAVKKGQPLAQLFVPDWVAAQEEFLSLKRMKGADLATLVDAARQRMRQAGMSDAQIAQVESTQQVQARVAVVSPIDGVIAELGVREGAAVAMGATLFRINGIGRVWVNAEVPETAARDVRPGTPVQALLPGGVKREGRVSAVLPEVNATTRTVKVRVELPNADRQLLPGVFVTLQLLANPRAEALLIPSEALMATGERNLVMLAQGEGRFMPVEVERGAESNGQVEIARGLQAGDRVVVSGQFLLDSEASLKGVQARQASQPASGASR